MFNNLKIIKIIDLKKQICLINKKIKCLFLIINFYFLLIITLKEELVKLKVNFYWKILKIKLIKDYFYFS